MAKKEEVLVVKLSRAERERLEALAADCGITLSEAARQSLRLSVCALREFYSKQIGEHTA